jgi:PAS domain S-box-containing protein
MKPYLPFDRVVGCSALLCAAAVAGLAMLAGLGWGFDRWRLTTFGAAYIPTAPSTALLLFVLAVGVLLRRRWPAKPATNAFGFVVVCVVALLSSSVLIPAQFGLAPVVEHWLAPTAETVGGVPVGRMSPVTASVFLLAAAALLLQLPPFVRWLPGLWLGSGLALAVVLIGLIVMLGYAVGAPLFYGGSTIPMALLTAAAFALLGLALLLTGGAATEALDFLTGVPSPERTPLALALSSSGTADTPARPQTGGSPGGVSRPSFPAILIVPFALLAVGIGISGFVYLRWQLADSRRTVQEALAAVADLKAGQIVEWRNQQLATARVVLESGILADHYLEWLADPADARAKNIVLNSMTALHKQMRYAHVRLWDQRLQVFLAVPAGSDRLDPASVAVLAQALHAKQVLLSDLCLSAAAPEHVSLSLFVPLLPARAAAAGATAPLGVLQLEIDAADFLFPLIQSWPTPSRSAETLLVRRDGDDVLYLNELRHQQHTALRLRRQINQPDLPAAMGARGEFGLREGLDYRREPVLSALRPIPDSPWVLVAKVDLAEIYAPLRQQALVTGFIVGTLILATLLTAGLLWRQRTVGLLRHSLAQEQQREILTKRLAYLSKHANDIILLAGPDWRILEANDRALETYGYSPAELQLRTVRDLRSPEARPEFDNQISRLDVLNGAVFETVHQRKDGSTFPVEISVRRIEWAGVPYYQFIVRDITERKRAEAALRAVSLRQEAILAAVPDIIAEVDTNKVYTWMNPAGLEFFGADAQGKEAAFYFVGEQDTYGVVQPLFGGDPSVIYVESWQRRQDGATRLLAWWCRVLMDAHGKVTGALSTARDITERRLAEQELRQVSEEVQHARDTLQTVVDSAPAGVVVSDSSGQIILANSKAGEILGGSITGDAFGPRGSYRLCRVDGTPFPSDELPLVRAIQRNESTAGTEILIQRDDGSQVVMLAAGTPLRNASGQIWGATAVMQDITDRKQAEQQLRANRARLAALSRQLISAQETERRHLARELHDEIGQVLTMISVNLKAVQGNAASGPSPRLEEAIALVDRIIQQVRNLSLDLRPSMLDDFGLASALRWYVERLTAQAGFKVDLSIQSMAGQVPTEVRNACFRVAQEALTNVVRHGKARQVRIALNEGEEEVELTVQDDGAGFDVAAARERAIRGGSVGLLGMQERVELLGGEFDIRSAPGEGTTIHARFLWPTNGEDSSEVGGTP